MHEKVLVFYLSNVWANIYFILNQENKNYQFLVNHSNVQFFSIFDKVLKNILMSVLNLISFIIQSDEDSNGDDDNILGGDMLSYGEINFGFFKPNGTPQT